MLLAAAAGCGLAACVKRRSRPVGLAVLALCWTLAQYSARAGDRLSAAHSRAVVTVTGSVTSVPARYSELTRFRFAPHADAGNVRLPAAIRVRWYHEAGAAPDVAPGQQWRLELRLQPPWGAVNFHGSDPERRLFARGIGALGTVRAAERLEGAPAVTGSANGLRERVVRAIDRNLSPGPGPGVVRALAVADRSGLDESTRQLLVDTGTAHLLAISGLHVGLAAAAGFWLLRALLAPFRIIRRGRLLLVSAAAGGLLAAIGYAVLADLGVSTLRAVAMVAVVLLAAISARAIHPASALLRAAAVVLLFDPFAPLGAGFWFSFGAVAALLAVFVPRLSRGAAWRRPVYAQLAVTTVLLPISAAWFGLTSALALPANLVAIPWVSALVVPPVLAGIAALPVSEALAAGLWRVAGDTAVALLWLLRGMAEYGPAPLGLNAPGTVRLLLALAGAFVLLLPSVMRWRWLALFLLLPLVLPARYVPDAEAVVFEVLDVGQGTSALLHTEAGTLVYDSGPGDGGRRNRVRPVILPAFGAGAPDRIVISHGDLDHAGGLHALAQRFPKAAVRLNAAEGAAAACVAGWSWAWGETVFKALHPSPGLPYLGNDSSCVLSVTGPAGRVLLPGDISDPIERRLLAEGLGGHDVLLAPHHGSNSSSGSGFLDRVKPRLAIATAAPGNRFGFPHPAVRERYRAAGVPLLTTGECGAIRVYLRDGEIQRVRSARRERARIWRWPAAAGCP
ncbi:MAG: DNA internalization-related competence protein ComEC/Rec2 [Xanthomonadales bacterium]